MSMDSATPVMVNGITAATAIGCGYYNSCAVINGGTVSRWGGNARGQVDGTFNNAPVPVPIAGLSNVAAVTAGGYHTCVLLLDGTINCWGTNLCGELGNGTRRTAIFPSRSPESPPRSPSPSVAPGRAPSWPTPR